MVAFTAFVAYFRRLRTLALSMRASDLTPSEHPLITLSQRCVETYHPESRKTTFFIGLAVFILPIWGIYFEQTFLHVAMALLLMTPGLVCMVEASGHLPRNAGRMGAAVMFYGFGVLWCQHASTQMSPETYAAMGLPSAYWQNVHLHLILSFHCFVMGVIWTCQVLYPNCFSWHVLGWTGMAWYGVWLLAGDNNNGYAMWKLEKLGAVYIGEGLVLGFGVLVATVYLSCIMPKPSTSDYSGEFVPVSQGNKRETGQDDDVEYATNL